MRNISFLVDIVIPKETAADPPSLASPSVHSFERGLLSLHRAIPDPAKHAGYPLAMLDVALVQSPIGKLCTAPQRPIADPTVRGHPPIESDWPRLAFSQ